MMSPTIFCWLVFLLPAAVRGFTLDDGNKKTLGTSGIPFHCRSCPVFFNHCSYIKSCQSSIVKGMAACLDGPWCMLETNSMLGHQRLITKVGEASRLIIMDAILSQVPCTRFQI